MSNTPFASAHTDDATFVLQASVHRDARLARCVFRSAGPNPKLPGDTLYLFEGRSCAAGMALALAISAPDALVTARDAAGLRNTYLARDAAYNEGGPWWLRPIGVPLADRAPAQLADVAPSASSFQSAEPLSPIAPDGPPVPDTRVPARRTRRPSLLRDLRGTVGAKLSMIV